MESVLGLAWVASASRTNASYTDLATSASRNVTVSNDKPLYQIVISLSAAHVIVTNKIEVGYIEVSSTPEENQMNRIESEILEIHKKVNTTEATLASISKGIDSVRSDGKWLIGTLAAIVLGAFGFIWTEIKGLDNDVDQLNIDVASMRSDIKYLKTNPLKSDINEIKDDINKKLEVLIKHQENTQP